MRSSMAGVCPLTVLAWRLAALPLVDVWLLYVELGGDFAQNALADYLGGTVEWTPSEHNVVAHALNEALWTSGCPSLAPYRDVGGDL